MERDNHVLTTTPPWQATETAGAAILPTPTCRTPTGTTTKTTKTTKTTNNRKRKRASPSSLSQSTTSSELSPILNEDTAAEDETTNVYDNIIPDVYTDETVNTPVHITSDAVYMYGCTPEVRDNSSPTREPDGRG